MLDVADWAAIISAESAEQLGAAGALEDIPPQQRRRLPPFTRNVLRCALPLLQAAPRTPIVYAAEHGDLDSTVTLLTDLARGEVLSPALFALSVHNAPAGALSLCLRPPGDHTAIAGVAHTLSAGLTEAYARLASDAPQTVLLILAEARLPEIYGAFDSDAPGVFLALTLRLGDEAGAAEIDVAPGRGGAVGVARALAQGRRRLRFALPGWQERAA